MLIGSPEWFREESKSEYNRRVNEMIENRRRHFLEWFAPEKLASMDKSTLLMRVFSPKETAMVHMLMYDADCRWFGAPGKYAYTGGVYYDQGLGTWKFKSGQRPEIISREEAEDKAVYMRDQLLYCIKCIQEIGVFKSLADYRKLQNKISKVFFYQYTWVLKYYQMLFPQFFSGMYADHTLSRALQILGLPDHENRFLNAGEISLFIRRCNVNCIVFGNIYGTKWGWERDYPPCEAASDNLKLSYYPVNDLDLSMYALLPNHAITLLQSQANERLTHEKTESQNDKKTFKTEKDLGFPNDGISILEKGCKVKHVTLGEGKVISNEKGRLVVNFKKHGLITLDANFVLMEKQIYKI